VIFTKTTLKLYGYLSHHNYGSKIFSKIEYKLLQDQNEKFLNIGLNRDQAIQKLNSVLSSLYGQIYSEKKGMWSEHLILFSAISNIENPPKKILEIGTFNGETARILSALFPKSKITTLDLELDEILKSELYKYETKDKKLVNSRDMNLRSLPNVTFLEKNSLGLIDFHDKFDLIWIDGEHSYPIASIDISNSIRLLSPTGVAICDDVYLKASDSNKDGRSTASIDSLESFSRAKLIDFNLLHKRVGFFFNFPSRNKKYLGYIKRKPYN
jgi:predicted O-methyltransferase YrrM